MRKSNWLMCLGMLCVAFTAGAADKPLTFTFATSGGDTSYDSNDDGMRVNVTFGKVKGSLGNGDISIASEWAVNFNETCPAGAVRFSMVDNKVVAVSPDLSQLIAAGQTGWMCVDMTTGYFYGVADGQYLGGTGRYKGATGTWTSNFYGYQLGGGFALLNGTVKGKLTK
jgi:hypothetical protein